tara:strand:- start:327 stop:632 length:306 start_codon:yes stop_codon:yes gene_type:complete
MKVRIQSVNFNIDRSLVDFVETKVSNLDKFYDKIIDAEVYLKVENTSDKENKIAEIKLNIPGGDLMVKKQCKTFEEGVDLAVDSLRRQLNKRKEKQRAHYS